MKTVKLGQLADIKLSNVDKKTHPDEQTVKLCNYTDVYKNSSIRREMTGDFMVASATKTEIEKFILRKGQVAITKDSETPDDIGVPAYIADDFDDVLLGYHLALITPFTNKLDGEYLNYHLNTKHLRRYFECNAGGSGQRCTLPVDTIKAIPLEIPDLENQKKIAAVLSALDAKIEVNNRINAELEAMAKTLYDYWFVQFDFPDANGKPYKSSGGKMIYKAELKREIPDGWEIGTLESLVEIKNGFAFKSADYRTRGVPVVRTKNFQEGSIVLNDVVFLSKDDAEDYEDFQLKKFDLLIVMVGASVGNNAIVPSHILPALQNQNMWNFRPKSSETKLFSNQRVQQIIAEQRHIASGSARSFFQKEYFYSLKQELAPRDISNKFESTVTPLFEKRDLILAENQYLSTLRDWLLPMLMNGQVTVKE